MDLHFTHWLLFVIGMTIANEAQAYVSIIPTIVDETENKTATFRCFHNGAGVRIRWVTNDNNICLFNIDSCDMINLPTDSKFNCKCHKSSIDTVLSLQITNISREDHNTSFTCVILSLTSIERISASLYIKVPARDVAINSSKDIFMREYEKQIIRCITSACRPTPTVKWHVKRSEEAISYDLTERSTQIYFQKEYGLVATESRLEFSPNRSINAWHLFCEVWTQSNISDIRSNEIVLNISYPPKGPPVINGYTNDMIHRVVESELITLNCSVTGGNPLPTLTMTCSNESSTTVVISDTSIIRFITWNATRYENSCTCESHHFLSGKQITYIKFEVLFPPTKVHFMLSGKGPVKDTFVANHSEELTFVCSSESNPGSDMIIRKNENEQLALLKNATSVTHTIHKVSCSDAGMYTCSARNLVTIGKGVETSIALIVKCPPRPSIEHILESNVTALLNSNAALVFVVHNYFDEQNRTQFTWYKQNKPLRQDNRKYVISSNGLNSILIIRNINDTDYGHYNVVVKNSVGQYIHYYTLLRTERDASVQSSKTGIIIGVAVGTFGFTLLFSALSFISYNYIRRNRSLHGEETRASENISGNQTTSAYDSINSYSENTTVYEQLDNKRQEGQGYMEIQRNSSAETHREYTNTTL